MPTKNLTARRLLLPFLAIAVIVSFASWDLKQKGNDTHYYQQSPTDTVPKKKLKKAKDLDEVLEELDHIDMDKEMKKVSDEMAKAMKEFDAHKIQLEVQKAIKDVDMAKIKEELAAAMKEINMEKIKQEMQASIAKIDFDKIKKELEEVQQKDFTKMKSDLEKMKIELSNLGPQLEKEMAKAKIDLSRAKEEIEKAKAEIKEYKEFVDGLEKDGLINKKEAYSIQYKDGSLMINGKKASEQTHSKYKKFLEKHKKFNIEKNSNDFDIDMD